MPNFPFRLLAAYLAIHSTVVYSDEDDKEESAGDKPNVLVIKKSRYTVDHFERLNTTNSRRYISEMSPTPSSVLDAITDIPGVSKNGQAGLFQVYSIRGVSRQRVLTYIDQIPLNSERRAGVASSFLHPSLLGSVDAIRGPASTIFLSGSLGGTVRLTPKFFTQTELQIGYNTIADRNYQLLGTGGESWSFGIGRQSSNRAEDIRGELLNDAYDQYSSSFIKEWNFANFDLTWNSMASYGHDIGRSSNRFPSRIVTVPQEKHFLNQLSFNADSWKLDLYSHKNSVETQTIRPKKRINLVNNQSHDFGLSYKKTLSFDNSQTGLSQVGSSQMESEWGIDYFVRDNVNAADTKTRLDSLQVQTHKSLVNAKETELGAYFTMSNYWGAVKWQLGSRFMHHAASNYSHEKVSDQALTGFLGLSYPLNDNLYLTANYGTGVRFPTLSERFFSGTTGRGEVIGNPDLDKEFSKSIDFGVKFKSQTVSYALNLYQQKISNYIERVSFSPEVLSFKNLTSGQVSGLELESKFNITSRFNVALNLAAIKGEDENRMPLIDIPSGRLNVKTQYQFDSFNWWLSTEYRHHKDKVAKGERVTPSALIVSSGLDYPLNQKTRIKFLIHNVFNEEYYLSQDELSPLSYGRGFEIGLNWTL